MTTCLCLTRNRRAWLRRAIDCFLAQTHRDAELLIVADGEDVRDLAAAGERVRLVHVEPAENIGRKRNLGCTLARGGTICHWDDDDYSAPGRLADQLARLEASRKAVTGYHSMRFTDGEKWWQYLGTPDYALGTSLCYRRAWWEAHPFPHLQTGEDNRFVKEASDHRQLSTADAGALMLATIHAGNSSPRILGSNWKLLDNLNVTATRYP